jgi:hypothetical protein
MNFLKAIVIILFGLIAFGLVAFFVYFGLDRYYANTDESVRNVFVQAEILAQKKVYADMAIEKALTTNPEEVSFDKWNTRINNAIILLDDVEKESQKLDEMSAQMTASAQRRTSLVKFFPIAYAVNSQEVIAVFDAAPAGKRLRTLANHFGVDARKARAMLKVAQGEITADSWNKAGDTFETLENTARMIKVGAKVSVQVLGTVASGGVVTAPATILEATGMVISNVDMALEIGEEVSKVALGYNSDAVAMIGDVRKILAPVTNIIAISNLNVLGDVSDKLNVVTFATDTITNAVYDDNYFGVEIDFDKAAVFVDSMNQIEMKDWLSEKGINENPDDFSKLVTNSTKTITTQQKVTTKNKLKDDGVQDNTEINNTQCELIGTKWQIVGAVISQGEQFNEDGGYILEYVSENMVKTYFKDADVSQYPPVETPIQDFTFENCKGNYGYVGMDEITETEIQKVGYLYLTNPQGNTTIYKLFTEDEPVNEFDDQEKPKKDSVEELSGNMDVQWGRAFGSLDLNREDWNAKWKLSSVNGEELNFGEPWNGTHNQEYNVIINDVKDMTVLQEASVATEATVSVEPGEYIIEVEPVKGENIGWNCNW